MTKISTMPPDVGPEFIARLLREAEKVKTQHAGNLAAVAASDLGGDLRQSYLAELLRFTAHDTEIVLLQIIGRPESPATSRQDRRKAAALYLYGAEHGLWKASKHHLRTARGSSPSPAKSPEPQNVVAKKADMKSVFAALQAGADMRRVLADPNGDHFKAVMRFTYALEDAGYAELLNAAFGARATEN